MSYPTFNDIEHLPLRIYNRTVMFYNILEDVGESPAKEYGESFSKEERVEMIAMSSLVRKHGPKAVKAWVTKGVVFPDYMSEEESLQKALCENGS